MNHQSSRPRLLISHGPKKKTDFESPPNLGGNLSPDLQPCSPPSFCVSEDVVPNQEQYLKIGKYVIRQVNPSSVNCMAVDQCTGDEYLCKVSFFEFDIFFIS